MQAFTTVIAMAVAKTTPTSPSPISSLVVRMRPLKRFVPPNAWSIRYSLAHELVAEVELDGHDDQRHGEGQIPSANQPIVPYSRLVLQEAVHHEYVDAFVQLYLLRQSVFNSVVTTIDLRSRRWKRPLCILRQ